MIVFANTQLYSIIRVHIQELRKEELDLSLSLHKQDSKERRLRILHQGSLIEDYSFDKNKEFKLRYPSRDAMMNAIYNASMS